MRRNTTEVWCAMAIVLGLWGCGPQQKTGETMAFSTSAGTPAPDDEDDEVEDEDEDDGDEDDDNGTSTGPDEDPDNSGPGGEASGPETTGPPDSGSGGAASAEEGGADPDLQMCLDMAADECEQCACNNCLPELMACQADPGCIAIRMCAQMAGCTGIDCLEPCGDVINANGGAFGEPANLARAVGECYTSSCPGC